MSRAAAARQRERPRGSEGGVFYESADRTACFLYPTPNAGTSKASQAFW
jgi:hypothetical protein